MRFIVPFFVAVCAFAQPQHKRMTEDILDASHYAEVSFVPQSYEGARSLTGDLFVLRVSKEVEIDLTLTGTLQR